MIIYIFNKIISYIIYLLRTGSSVFVAPPACNGIWFSSDAALVVFASFRRQVMPPPPDLPHPPHSPRRPRPHPPLRRNRCSCYPTRRSHYDKTISLVYDCACRHRHRDDSNVADSSLRHRQRWCRTCRQDTSWRVHAIRMARWKRHASAVVPVVPYFRATLGYRYSGGYRRRPLSFRNRGYPTHRSAWCRNSPPNIPHLPPEKKNMPGLRARSGF